MQRIKVILKVPVEFILNDPNDKIKADRNGSINKYFDEAFFKGTFFDEFFKSLNIENIKQVIMNQLLDGNYTYDPLPKEIPVIEA